MSLASAKIHFQLVEEKLEHILPILAAGFNLLEKAAALKVHPGKTQICIVAHNDNDKLLSMLSALRGDWNKAKMVQAILYLGSKIGPSAHAEFWQATIGKMKIAAKALSDMQLATTSALQWFPIVVQSIPQYLASIKEPNGDIRMCEQTCLSKALHIPHQSIPIYSWGSMDLLGIKAGVRTMQWQSVAARCRVYMRSQAFPRIVEDIEKACASDDATQIFPHEFWRDHSTVYDIHNAYHFVHSLDPPLWYDDTLGLQREVLLFLWPQHIQQLRAQDALMTMSRRLQQLGVCVDRNSLPSRLAMFKHSLSLVPSFVQMAFVKSAFGAMNTSHRYGKEVKPCPWCGVVNGDSIHHLLVCGIMLEALAAIRPLLRMSWLLDGHPPLLPSIAPAAVGLDLVCTAQGEDLLRWHDFIHTVYNDACKVHDDIHSWRQAWNARSRAVHRYSTTNR